MADVSARFKMRQKQQYWWSWRMWREGRPLSSLCNYVLTGGYVMWRGFTALSMCFDTDQQMLLGKMVGRCSTNIKIIWFKGAHHLCPFLARGNRFRGRSRSRTYTMEAYQRLSKMTKKVGLDVRGRTSAFNSLHTLGGVENTAASGS